MKGRFAWVVAGAFLLGPVAAPAVLAQEEKQEDKAEKERRKREEKAQEKQLKEAKEAQTLLDEIQPDVDQLGHEIGHVLENHTIEAIKESRSFKRRALPGILGAVGGAVLGGIIKGKEGAAVGAGAGRWSAWP